MSRAGNSEITSGSGQNRVDLPPGDRVQACLTATAPCAPRAGSETGFTLIEVMAVVVILALAMAAFIVRTPASNAATELASLSSAVASELRTARADALSSGTERTVLFDVTARKVISEQRNRAISFTPDYALHATAAATERRSATQAAIRFFANGSSTGGGLKIERGRLAHEVRINWLSGRVVVVTP